MPPEPFPWDRRDFRKHERSGTDPRFGGGYGGGGPPRWREHHHPNAPPPHPPPYHHHQQQQRWYSDFRSRPLPPGHGKQNGWHMNPDEACHGFPSCGSRLSDRNIEENYRSFGSCSDGGRHFRNNRENRGSFSQKYWRATSWEPVSSSNAPGRSVELEPNNQRSIENTQAGTNNCSANNNEGNNSSPLPPDSIKMLDQSQSTVEDNQVKDAERAEGLGSTVKTEKESYVGSINWKPLKWARSGSLSSRGSSLSRSSSSKSMGVDSIDTVTEVLQKKVTPIQSPTSDASADVIADIPAPSEENISRKKPRLGWGDGLAKYEKKKTDGPEDDAIKNSLFVSVSSAEETLQFHMTSLLDKSPRCAGFLDGASPATPSSFAFSSSPGIDEKGFTKTANVDQDASNFSSSPSIMSHTPYEGLPFNLENLEPSFLTSMSSLISELLQSDDPGSGDTHHVGVNKVLSWKGEITKALERTEFEIDSLETEHRLLTSEPRSSCQLPDLSSAQPEDFCLKHCEGQVTASDPTLRPCPSRIASSGDMNVENVTRLVADTHVMINESIDSPCCETSNCVEESPSGEEFYPPQAAKDLVNLDVNSSRNSDENCLDNCHFNGQNNDHAGYHELTVTTGCRDLASDSDMHYYGLDVCASILAFNKGVASGASETLNKLLPSKQHPFDAMAKSAISCLQSDSSLIKMKFLRMKRFFRFKEKALTIKYKLFKHFWRQERIVSLRKLREMSLKKFDVIELKKHRYSRARISCSAGNSRTVSAEDIMDVVGIMLSESSFKPCRNTLKMPALILDKEVQTSRFVSNNGMVEDLYAFEKDRSMINSWTPEEREIFIDKFGTFGKDFKKIASFLDHKRTADCVEFYYKNHKSDCFEKARKLMKQNKSQSTTYLVASGKRRSYEDAAASLEMLGAASEIVATVNVGIEMHEKLTPKVCSVAANTYKTPRCHDGPLQRSNSLDLCSSEREAVAADVLAGICGSLSSEAVSSCITSSVDHGDGYHDWRCQRVGLCSKPPFTSEFTRSADDECSDDSCEELDPTDWSDEEKSIFMQALSSYGKDFGMISRCVKTRTRDQCKVFYGKGRKCLRLDEIQSGLAVSGDVDGGDSDVEDACVLETGLVISNEGSNCKMEEPLPHPHVKLGHKVDTTEGTCLLKPDKRHVENISRGSVHPMETETVSKNLLMDNCQCDDKHNLDFNVNMSGQNGVDGVCVSVQELGTMAVSPNKEILLRVEEPNDYALANGSIESESRAFVEVSDVYHSKENLEPKKNSPTTKVERPLYNSIDVSAVNCIVRVKSESQLDGNVPQPSLAVQVDDASECQMRADLEYHSTEKSHLASLQQNDHIASLRSSTLFTVPIKYQKLFIHNTLSPVDVNGVDDEHSQKTVRSDDCKPHGHPLSDPVESSKILSGHPLCVPIVSEDISSCLDCKMPVPLQNTPCSNGKLHSGHRLGFSLQKCNSSRHHCEVEASRPLMEQTVDQSRPLQPSCSSNVEKISKTGDVKLFGKILTSSQQKSNSIIQRKDDNSSWPHKSCCPSLNLKFSGEQVNLDSGVSKFACINSLVPENIPVKNFGFWDGKRMQTGLPPMLDSALLLAKYPTAFNNYARPAAKGELPAPQGVVNSNNHPLNGVTVFPSRELCSGNGVADCIRNREVTPFTLDMKNPREIFFSEMQRQNVFNVVSEMQHQSRGIIGSAGALVGGQCSGVSDPVAAIKMHYAKAERFSLQAGNIIKEEDTWRNKGDIGRL